MRLGYNEWTKRASPPACRFNEAEAHAPRIRAPIGIGPKLPKSFNEAEAHAPRIRCMTPLATPIKS